MEPLPQTEEILAQLQLGKGLATICREMGLVRPTVILHLESDPIIADRYARARRDGLDAIAEDIERIADDLEEDPNSRKVRIDARKWLLSKLRPDKYGDRLELAGQVEMSLAEGIRASRRQRELAEQPPKQLDKPGASR